MNKLISVFSILSITLLPLYILFNGYPGEQVSIAIGVVSAILAFYLVITGISYEQKRVNHKRV